MESVPRILIVDDDISVLEMTTSIFRIKGYEIVSANSESTALKRVAEQPPAVALIDLHLGDTSGLDLIRKIKNVSTNTECIIITGYASQTSAVEAINLGAYSYFHKPYDVEKLFLTVNQAIEKQEVRMALSESEERFRSMAQTASDAIIIASEDGVIQFFNDAAARIFGYRPVEIVGQPVEVLMPKMFRGRHRDGLGRFRKRGESHILGHTVELKGLGKDGRIFPLELSLSAAYTGQKTTFTGIIRDLTQRRQAEETLRRRERALASMNTIATSIGRSRDREHILERILEQVLAVVAMDGGAVHLLDGDTATLSLIVHRGMNEKMVTSLQSVGVGEGIIGRVAASGSAAQLNGPMMDDGDEDPATAYTLTALPIQTGDKIVGVLSVVGSQSQELGEVDLAALDSICRQIGIAIENLRLADEAAEVRLLQEVDRFRSELIANVSHELRTPLGLIKVFSTTLLSDEVELEPKTQAEFLQHINEETDNLEAIVNMLLDASRIESGRLSLEKLPADLTQLAKAVIDDLALDTPAEQFSFVHDFPEKPIVVPMDAKRIEQALRNLLGNAIKFSPDGGVITVQGRQDKWQTLVVVSDQGVGVPEPDLERVFERFYRVEDDFVLQTHGVGLGLSVSKGIIDAHNGRIWVDNKADGGSSFCFTLPTNMAAQN